MNQFIPPLSRVIPQALSPAEIDLFARRTGWVDDIAVIDAEHTSVQRSPLPWWPGVDLIVARDALWEGPLPLAVWLQVESRLHRLVGRATPIHAINARIPPKLDDETVLPYLGFFCFFISAAMGPFVILECLEDAGRIGSAINEQSQDKLRPAKIVGSDDDGYRCEAVVWYSNALFLANFMVRRNGVVEMLDDEPLVADVGAKCEISFQFRPLEVEAAAAPAAKLLASPP